jgi:hypothetical protein
MNSSTHTATQTASTNHSPPKTVLGTIVGLYNAVALLDDTVLEIFQNAVSSEATRRKELTGASLASTQPPPMAPAPYSATSDVRAAPVRLRSAASRAAFDTPRVSSFELAAAIYEKEGFRVEIFGAGQNTFLRPFSFQRRMRSDCTVQQWKAIRFARMYPGLRARVHLADGAEAHGAHMLGTVRSTYEMKALQ